MAERPAADASQAPEIELYELDGIPLAFMPMAGSTILSLSFGTGRADEPITATGMTHLAEHLLLTQVRDGLDHSNGTTESFRVTFVHRGAPDDAATFLRDVCAAIRAPRFGRLHTEANVLRSEAALRQEAMPMSLRLVWLRTGYQGVGTTNLPEYFLRWLDEEALATWMRSIFVAGNAAIWIAGQLPDDLYVDLEPGPRWPRRQAQVIAGFETPTLFGENAPGVGASFQVARSLAVRSALATVEAHLRKILRVERGLGYDIGSEYMPFNADDAYATLWATCLPKDARDVEQIMLETIDDVAARGPSEDELARQHREAAQQYTEPMAIPARLDSHARDVLLGGETLPASLDLDRRWRMRPEEVAAAFRKARDSMLLLVPPAGTRPQRPWRPYPGIPTDGFDTGQSFEHLTLTTGKGPFGKKRPHLFVGAEGVALVAPTGTRVAAIRWSDAAAVVWEANGRLVLGLDGSAVGIARDEWRDSREAIRLVDHWSPRDRVVRLSKS